MLLLTFKENSKLYVVVLHSDLYRLIFKASDSRSVVIHQDLKQPLYLPQAILFIKET